MTEQEHSERTLARQGLSERVDAVGTAGGKASVATYIRESITEVPALLERDILSAVIQVLNFDKRVAFAYRSNSGVFKVDDRYIKAGFKGQPDITAMLLGGKALYVEVKRQGEKPTDDQQAFGDLVNRSGGLWLVARSVADVRKALESA